MYLAPVSLLKELTQFFWVAGAINISLLTERNADDLLKQSANVDRPMDGSVWRTNLDA
jgi:hypothetical protein